MILMALDHVRDAYSSAHIMGTDILRAAPAVFATRWITHFCAPAFVFLAGLSARIQTDRGKSRRELSWFLLTRGAWILAVEIVWIHLGMTLDFRWHFILLQTLWAIGWSMAVLSALVWLPPRVVGAIGVAICLGHNLLDGHVGTRADARGPCSWPDTAIARKDSTFRASSGRHRATTTFARNGCATRHPRQGH